MASGIFLSGLFFIVLSSLSSASNRGIKDKDPRLSQPQASVSVIIGEVLHLDCKVHSNLIPEPVKWFLGEGSQWKLIYGYESSDAKDERITRNFPGSKTDFSISIRNVTLEDAGTYYCMKENKRSWGSMDWLEGPGTQVVVKGINDKDPQLSQPQMSVSVIIGEVLHLDCKVHSNFQSGPVKWFLGEGSQRKIIYATAETDAKDGRITRNSPGSRTDFSISIRNVALEDAGTYYCVKEHNWLWGSMDWLKGPGTRVVVKGLQGQSIYALYLGLFLNKVAMALLLFGLFQTKQQGGCFARYFAKSRPV